MNTNHSAMQKRTIRFFDTTLRDGEQTPGVNLNTQDKLRIAAALEELGIDAIEAGFAAASPGDFEAVSAVASQLKHAQTVCLCRAVISDIEQGAMALERAARPALHTFIATSDIHMQYKLRMSREQVLNAAGEAVRRARALCPFVEFSCEDATRSDREFLFSVLSCVIAEGADVINIPDTVGYTEPAEYAALIRDIIKNVPGADKVILSVHCHNDLGNAVANSLAALEAGACQVEGTINGIGERAGNAALEEVVMNLVTRKEYYNLDHGIRVPSIYRVSHLVSSVCGIRIPSNKPVTGQNAFTHQSGIHQHGMLSNPSTYEIITPETIGAPKTALPLGKLSGKHAFSERLSELGLKLEGRKLDEAFAKFKELADRKREIDDRDLAAIASQKVNEVPKVFELQSFRIYCGNGMESIANLVLTKDGATMVGESTGSGPVDAAFKAVDKIAGMDISLHSYDIKAVTGGRDALGEVTVVIKRGDILYRGRGVSTDIIESSILAYIEAINRALSDISGAINGR